MSTSSDEFPERRRLSNVSFSSISSDVLLVRIRKMSEEVKEEDTSKVSNTFQSISRNAVSDRSENSNNSKSTMADCQETASTSSQTSHKERIPISETGSNHDSIPCLKHAAENISRKASRIPSEKINLCNDCSKSMLSYIFLVQDFLDGLAKEIIGNETSSCLQCARQEVRDSVATSAVKDMNLSNIESTSRKRSDHKSTATCPKDVSHDRHSYGRTSSKKSHREEYKRKDSSQKVINTFPEGTANKHEQKNDFIYSASPPLSKAHDIGSQNISNISDGRRIIVDQSSSGSTSQQHIDVTHDSSEQQWTSYSRSLIDTNQAACSLPTEKLTGKDAYASQYFDSGSTQHYNPYVQTYDQREEPKIFRTPKEREQPNYSVPTKDPNQSDRNNNLLEKSPNLYREDVDGIVSTLSTAEREIYDSARNRAGWESLTESQEKLGVPPGNIITSEAFVTSCRNNAEAIGCLVLGTSLLLCRTSRTLCVLVSEGVSTAFRNAFSSVFQVVQYVRSLDSLGTTKLALLEQPELGINFEKLNIWRLVQFSKCIYLNPDTLVIQNCDELFCREELSAVPDIGWPDCFNSGVFVYSPSVHTFWQLLEFAEKQGSYDGGDQGLLNSYFNTWSSDISKKLSFIYNLMANVSYTYSPAFRQFGRDVKIVQFHGSFKPWHVKFFTQTGQISPSSPVHPTYVQFVHVWINIFRITVLRLLSENIQSYAASQETISAVETLRFFPLPTESEAEFFLTPPSVRLRLAEMKLNKSSSLPVSEARRRKSAEFFRYQNPEEDVPETVTSQKEEKSEAEIIVESTSEMVATDARTPTEKPNEGVSETDEVFREGKDTKTGEKVIDENTLPGSEVGDYQGMKAWEQGRMDYEGTDRSDNIIKRLQFLMNPKPK